MDVASLPDAVLQAVFGHLRSPSDLVRSAAVCVSWRALLDASNAAAWRASYVARWGRDEARLEEAFGVGGAVERPRMGRGRGMEGTEEEDARVGGGWKAAAVDRERRERRVVGILDDMVWPDRRGDARERLRTLLGPVDDAAGRGRRLDQLSYALDKEVGWDGKRVLSRRCCARKVKMHLVEFDVCAELEGLFGTQAADTSAERAVEECERAACCIARLLDNDLNVCAVHAALDKLGAELRRRVDLSGAYDGSASTIAADPLPAVEILNHLFFDDPNNSDDTATLLDPSFAVPPTGGLGFKGNVGNYYDRFNSSLARVLLRRTGIPITLSILYAAVARRAGLEVRFLNNPGHFVCYVLSSGSTGEVTACVIDVFAGGTFGPQVPLNNGAPEIVPSRSVCLRVLNNLRIICRQGIEEGESGSPFYSLDSDVNALLYYATLNATAAFIHELPAEMFEAIVNLSVKLGYVHDIDWRRIVGQRLGQSPEDVNDEIITRAVDEVRQSIQPPGTMRSLVGKIDRMDTLFRLGNIVQEAGTAEQRLFVVGQIDESLQTSELIPLDPAHSYLMPHFNSNSTEPWKHGIRERYKAIKLDALPAATTRDDDLMWCLGTRFESFDAARGVFVPNAHLRWKYGWDEWAAEDVEVRTQTLDSR